MIDGIDLRSDADDRQVAGWRGVISAWALVLLFLLLLAAVNAVACPRDGSQSHRHLAGAVIPQRDPCAGPGVASATGVDGCENLPVSEGRSAYW